MTTATETTTHESVIDAKVRQDAMTHERIRELARKKGLTEKDHAEARSIVREFCETRRIEPKNFAISGVSISAFTQWQTGKFKGDSDRVLRAVMGVIDREFRGLDIAIPFDFIETKICDAIIRIMKDAHANRDAAIIFGPSGIGKTVACKVVSLKAIPNAVHIECTEGESRPGSFVRLLATSIGCETKAGGIGAVQRAIIEHLKKTGQFIIIDEGQYLGEKCLNILRDIKKLTDIGLAFVGTIDLDRKVDDATAHFGQWARLIVFRYDITDELCGRGGDGYFSVDEMAMYCKASNVTVLKRGLERITELANIPGWGGLGQAKNVLRVARLLSDGGSINLSHIDNAYSQMHGRRYVERANIQMGERRKRLRGQADRTRGAA